MFYRSLQNGSDIRGVALEGIEGQSVNLTENVCRTIALSFVEWLAQQTQKPVSSLRVGVGRDSRLSGSDISRWVCETIAFAGATVYDCGLASTPAMFMTTVLPEYKYDGSIMITASHLPFNRNGMKFFTQQGGLNKQDITDILNIASTKEDDDTSKIDKVSYDQIDFIPVYAQHLVSIIQEATGEQKPLTGLRILVDAGNGAGGFFAKEVLEPLGADTTGSQFLDPDGAFPNHMPNPEDKEAMESITRAVLQNKADLGVIFDTDVDRAGAVFDDGSTINRNRLIALISVILLEEFPQTTIVTDSITSTDLTRFIEANGGKHHRFKRGYKNVINESIRLNENGQDSQLAIETSGHGALKENYFLDDGAYLITKILIKMAQLNKENKKLSSLVADLAEPVESVEIRMSIKADDFQQAGAQVLENVEAYAKKSAWDIAPNNYEGLRVSFPKEEGDGWFLLRMSLHDPLMPLNIESDTEAGSKKIATALYEALKSEHELVDLTKLTEFINA